MGNVKKIAMDTAFQAIAWTAMAVAEKELADYLQQVRDLPLSQHFCKKVIHEDRMQVFRVLLDQRRFGRILRPGLSVPMPKCAGLAQTQSVCLNQESTTLAKLVYIKQVTVACFLKRLGIVGDVVREIGLLLGLPWL